MYITSEQKLLASAHDSPCSLFPANVSDRGRSTNLGSGVKMTQSRAMTSCHGHVVRVRNKPLLLKATASGVICYCSITDPILADTSCSFHHNPVVFSVGVRGSGHFPRRLNESGMHKTTFNRLNRVNITPVQGVY